MTTVVELCGSAFTGFNSKIKTSVGKKTYDLYGYQMNTLSWYFAIAGHYSYLGTSDYIDVEESVDRLTKKDLHVEATTVKMLEWREQVDKVDKHLAKKVKNPEIVEVINIILTLIARFAHHQSIEAQLAYVCETFEALGMSATQLYGGF
eukprot:SAG31_NODE_6162_length_2143_cov_1.747554_1_plen_149_part_00